VTPVQTPRALPLAAIGAGAGLAGATAWLFTHDPSRPGAHFPACPFHAMTGLWCPACGLTRGTYALLHGHLATALGENVFTPMVAVAAVVAWWSWAHRTSGRRIGGRVASRLPAQWTTWLAGVLVVYGVVRNLPLPGCRALAP
jgi:Protein of unknown function (DUF2752)